MTIDTFYGGVAPSDYTKEFLANLDNPHRIWKHAYHQHISRAAQDLLIVLASFPDEAFLNDVHGAFSEYHRRRAHRLNWPISPRAFEDALRELDGDFIHTSLVGSEYLLSFSNPSVRDFLNATLSGSPESAEDIVSTATYFEQLSRIWRARLETTKATEFIRDDKLFARRIKELIGSQSPVVQRQYGSRGATTVVREREASSDRLLFVLEASEELQTAAIGAVAAEILGEDEGESLDVTDFNKDAVVKVLFRLQKRRSWSSASSRLFELVRTFLLDSLEDPDDYKILAEFASTFPDAVASERGEIERKLRAAFNDWSSDAWYESDVIWGLHTDLEDIRLGLEIGIADLLYELEDRARELERKDRVDRSVGYSAATAHSSNETAEIHALFTSLQRP